MGMNRCFFIKDMIIFNTIKKAEHYVKWCRKTKDYYNEGYDWSVLETLIDGEYVIEHHAGDGCGCGCDLHLYDYKVIIGRIKSWNDKTIRDNKIKSII
jgi:hypothetical protein